MKIVHVMCLAWHLADGKALSETSSGKTVADSPISKFAKKWYSLEKITTM